MSFCEERSCTPRRSLWLGEIGVAGDSAFCHDKVVTRSGERVSLKVVNGVVFNRIMRQGCSL